MTARKPRRRWTHRWDEPQDLLATPTAQTLLSPPTTHEQSLGTGGPSAVSHWRELQRVEGGGDGGHETMAGCHCPGLEPRPSPPSCLLRSGSHSPTGPFGGLPSPRWRDFYHAFGFSLNQLPLPGYLTPTVSVSERGMRHGRGNWGLGRWPMTGGGTLCFGSSQVEAAKIHLR